MKKRLTIIRYKPETCTICGGTLQINEGAVRWCERDEYGRVDVTRPLFAHPACDNPDEDNFTVAPCVITGAASNTINPDDETAERPSLATHIRR